MSDYEKQAQDFMDKYGVTMKAEFLYHGPYFDDDKEKRDVYNITLSRNGVPWVFKFGQSLDRSGPGAHGSYYEAYMNKKRGLKRRTPPAPYDVLACLQKYNVGTFHDFCGDFGYDTDSTKARELYFRVQKEAKKVQSMFHDCMEELLEIV